MKIESLNDFILVGGTALALYKGYRMSIDIDLFSANIPFNADRVIADLKASGKTEVKDQFSYAMFLTFDDVKTDILKYPYTWLSPPNIIDGIRIASLDDIIPMKLAAVSKRGVKKDFYDIFFLMEDYTLDQMLALYRKKYPESDPYMVLKSLTYFVEAEISETPVVFDASITWDVVKKKVVNTTAAYL